MINDQLHCQLTVSQLREALVNAQDGAVVGISLRAGFAAHPEIDCFYNLSVANRSSDGPVFTLVINSHGVVPPNNSFKPNPHQGGA